MHRLSILLIISSILCLSCQEQDYHLITSTEERTAAGTTNNFEIDFPEDQELLFFELHLTCSNYMSFSGDEFKLLSYKKLIEINSNDLKNFNVLRSNNNKEAKFSINDRVITKISTIGSGGSHASIPTKKKYCDMALNALYYKNYDPRDETNESMRNAYIVGFVPIIEIQNFEDRTINWDAVFADKELLYWIYRDRGSCTDQPLRIYANLVEAN